MKKVLSVVLAIAMVLALVPAGVVTASAAEGDFVYQVSGSGVMITGYTGAGGDLIIPDVLGGLTVTSIYGYGVFLEGLYDGAFYGNTSITSVTIPESITSIGVCAFWGCNALTTINFNAKKCTSLGVLRHGVFYNAFEGYNISTINFGDSVETIPEYAFSGTGVTEITIPESVTSIGNSAFEDCLSLKTVNFNAVNCSYMGSELHSVFARCGSVKTLNIGDNVQTIPSNAFSGCFGVLSLNIPDSVTYIGALAFAGITLTSLTIPENVVSIGWAAFSGKIDVLNFNAKNCSTSGLSAFEATNIQQIIFGSSVQNIPAWAFYEQSQLKSVTIPANIENTGSYSFYGCIALERVTVQNGLLSIEQSFSGCSGLKIIIIPESVTSIDDYTFDGCGQLTIYCFENSYAHNYALNNSIDFELISIMPKAEGPGCTIDYQGMFINKLPSGITSLDGFLDIADGCTLSYTPTANGFGTGSSVNVIKNGVTVESFQIVIPGDISGNGKITALDALMLLQISAGSISLNQAQQLACDVNGDAVISAVDALRVLQFASGIITVL
jgi:hypothetical protein